MKSCILLCGGQSRRMGQDKGSMNIHGKPMIIHILTTLNNIIDEAVIVLNNEDRIIKYKEFIEKHEFSYKIRFVEDEIKDKGPLSGILTGLKHISSDYALVLPCDSPYITKNHVNTLFNEISNDYDCIVPYNDDENKIKTSEPLHSIYNKNNIDTITNLIEKDILHIKGLLKEKNCKFIKIDNKKLLKKEFRNLNRPEDI
ncbi:MAG: molybdenum cofactor guanylyltransferase [Methanobrevibacter sp.]|uniref:molybdenum cofactor guanylyltransferase n=1 Tax=Methanobrevibacter sp. TaxID=66852 RepID=UPI0026DF77C0|nr:molybdenum cofactor guanylyltransferase [Methanobrevibacter sp.]MDO5849108.1 molybdenum cofactor guanylyltransferase [Methanobrevibacter sp.]